MKKIKIERPPLRQSENSALVLTVSKEELIDAFKTKYVREFGHMDDRAYFMSGILIDVIDELFSTSALDKTVDKFISLETAEKLKQLCVE